MILFLSNVDTDLLALRSVVEDLPVPLRSVEWLHLDRCDALPPLDRVEVVILRRLGGRSDFEEPLAQLHASCEIAGAHLVAVGGEVGFDPDLARASTVPGGIVAEAHRYLALGGPANVGQLLRFLSDTVLLTGYGFAPPAELPLTGVWDGAGIASDAGTRDPTRPLVAVIFYRAHLMAGNTTYVRDLCDALAAHGADALAVYAYSLRPGADGEATALDVCRDYDVDAIVTSTLAAGSTRDAGDGWDVPGFTTLGIPVIQSPASSRARADWLADDAGLVPLDVATGVAIPEFDGRIIGPTYAFKEIVDASEDPARDLVATRAAIDRADQLARLAVRHARLRHIGAEHKRVAIVLSAYPTTRSRLGNAVGLDTPASAVALLEALREAGYRVDRIPTDGDALMAELVDGLTYEEPVLTDAQSANAAGRLDAGEYTAWFEAVGPDARGAWRSCGEPHRGRCTSIAASWSSPGSTSGACSSRSNRRAGSAPTRSRRTTPRTCRRRTTTSRSIDGSRRRSSAGDGMPTRSSTWASTELSNGSPGSRSPCRRTAIRSWPSTTCRCSIPSSSTTPAKVCKRSGEHMR